MNHTICQAIKAYTRHRQSLFSLLLTGIIFVFSFVYMPQSEEKKQYQTYATAQSISLLPMSHPFITEPMGDYLEGRTFYRVGTAYQPVPEQTDSTPCIAASGLNVCQTTKKICASNEFPFGTQLLIAGEVCEVQDRMNKRFPDRIDLLFMTAAEVNQWGKRTVPITLLD